MLQPFSFQISYFPQLQYQHYPIILCGFPSKHVPLSKMLVLASLSYGKFVSSSWVHSDELWTVYIFPFNTVSHIYMGDYILEYLIMNLYILVSYLPCSALDLHTVLYIVFWDWKKVLNLYLLAVLLIFYEIPLMYRKTKLALTFTFLSSLTFPFSNNIL